MLYDNLIFGLMHYWYSTTYSIMALMTLINILYLAQMHHNFSI